MLACMHSFVERPTEAFGLAPVCPFGTRPEDKIKFFVVSILSSEEEIIDEIVEFTKQHSFEVLVVVDPDKTVPIDELRAFTERLSKLFGSYFMFFVGHPDDETKIAGVKCRQDPYPNFQVVRTAVVTEARKKLFKMPYYARWSEDKS